MVPQALRDRAQWLVWKSEPPLPTSKTGKMRKIPHYATGRRRSNEQGTPEDRALLTTFEHALDVKSRQGYAGVGFAFLKGDGLVGIDLDHVVDDDGVLSDQAVSIVQACASFTEWSPSKTGLHIYCLGETPEGHSFKSNKLGIEVFSGVQFFTVTGEQFPGTPGEVTAISAEAMAMLYELVKGKAEATPARPAPRAPRPPSRGDLSDEQRAEAALEHVPADDYQTWIDIGHALKHAFGDGGFAIWDGWSSKGTGYRADEMAKRWAGFRPSGGVTIGTVFALAKQHGYAPARRTRDARPATRPGARDDGEQASPGAESSGAGGGDGGGGDDGGERRDPHFEGDYDPAGLPLIDYVQGELPQVVDEAEDVMLDATDMGVYQRDRMLVRVIRRPVPSVRNYQRPAGTLGIVPVEMPYLVDTLTRAAHWQRWNPQGKGKFVRINCPDKVASTYLARAGEWRVPQLWSVITVPTLRPDGTILQRPGYDPGMKALYDPCGIDFPLIPDKPTEAEARAALAVLRKAFSTFPWVEPVDESVSLSLALCALVRRSLNAAPLGAITAPVMASGKTLLADAISILPSGSVAPAMSYNENEEEFNKTLFTVLMEGDPVVLIDNVSHPLAGDALCSILTSERYSQRILGKNEMGRVQTTTLLLANGNQLVIAGDLRTRAVMVRLDAGVERPEEREFQVDLRNWFIEHRPRLVAAGLTVMRAWQVSEKKNAPKPFGRFEQWSDMVRAPLIWLGLPDPCDSIKELEKDDPERGELRTVLHALRDHYGNRAVKASVICAEMMEAHAGAGTEHAKALASALAEVARDRDGRWNARRLATWLRKRSGRRVDGMMLVKGDEVDHTSTWRIDEEPDVK